MGGGTPFFTAIDRWVKLNLMETRTLARAVDLTRYETRRWRDSVSAVPGRTEEGPAQRRSTWASGVCALEGFETLNF